MTKYRRKIFTVESLEYLHQTMKDTAAKMGFLLVEFNGKSDHVHLLIRYPPKYSISKLVNHLKGVESRMYRLKFDVRGKHLWSPSYFASSVVGAPIEIRSRYIQDQKPPSASLSWRGLKPSFFVIGNRNGQRRVVDAVIDTGYTGFISLPRRDR